MLYYSRMRIYGQEFSTKTIKRLNDTVNADPEISRHVLSKQVCGWLNWRGENGNLKEMSCRKALLQLHRKGEIVLPERKKPALLERKKPLKAVYPVDLPEVNGDLSELGTVEFILIESRYKKESRIWNYIMEEHHYLGAGPLCGAQIRYLVKSSCYGWIGGLSFSAPAWALKRRDEIIGWSNSARSRNLQRVVCNSRFLIIPTVRVPNLASRILSRCASRLADDWRTRYGYEPVLLETFIDCERFHGTCYRAANWILVGETTGRGRQDRYTEKSVTLKHIFLYPLRKDWQKILCEEPIAPLQRKSVLPPKEAVDWAEEEFRGVELGDIRLRKRLLDISRDFYARPGANVTQAVGTRAKAKGVYRFFDHKNTDMMTLLKPHYEATEERIKEHRVVLAVQDTTTLNYSAHPATEGLGTIGTMKKNTAVGLILHDTMVFSEQGTPLGLLDVQCWRRDPEDFGRSKHRHNEPIENKESIKWLKSYRAASQIQKRCLKTTIVSVGDRESDIHELFVEALDDSGLPKLLVRAERTRQRMVEHETLWENMDGKPVAGIQEIYVPRQGSRQARHARLEVRFGEVMLRPPKKKKMLKEVTVWAVFAREIDYDDEIKSPLEWMLLTTIEVSTFEQAIEKLEWYARRWGIEVYHKTLKSGCKIEDRQLGNAERIESCLAIDMVVAWRIYHLAKLGRETPDLPCTVYFDEDEWKSLVIFKTKNPVPPKNPPCLRDAIRMVASLGGFLGRKSDGEPGTTSLWRGLQRLDDITVACKIFMPQINEKKSLVSSETGYG